MQAAEKEEFRSYLEKSGVIDSLTKVLVGLYEEPDKPASAVEFIKQHLGSAVEDVNVQALRQENEVLKRENESLKKKVEELLARLDKKE
ncbi:c-Myc-binding protein-like [Balamuthia mandrillaris]